MAAEELLEIVSSGETSKVQFKERMPHPDSIAAALIAFSNSKGGVILFGINDKNGELNGLSFDEIRDLNQQIVNIASGKIYPPVYVTTETVSAHNQKIVVITVDEGLSDYYF